MKKLLSVIVISALLVSGCAWFCKINIPEVRETLRAKIAHIQSDYNGLVDTRDQLVEALALNPDAENTGFLKSKLASVVFYLGLADQALVIGCSVLQALQDGICVTETITADAEAKASAALAVKP